MCAILLLSKGVYLHLVVLLPWLHMQIHLKDSRCSSAAWISRPHCVHLGCGTRFFFGVTTYCFEGIGMVLPVRNSMRNPESFKLIWGAACTAVAVLYLCFGCLGYVAFGDSVDEIITMNLPHGPLTVSIKVSLCVGLLFTYPIMCAAERRTCGGLVEFPC